MAVACAATVFAVVFPAQPASADFWGEICQAEPRAPFMIDPKLYLLDGATRGVCKSKMTAVIVESTLERYIATVGEWRVVSEGRTTKQDWNEAWADAFLNCGGMGDEVQFRTQGKVTGLYGYGGSSHHNATSATAILNCTKYIPEIQH